MKPIYEYIAICKNQANSKTIFNKNFEIINYNKLYNNSNSLISIIIIIINNNDDINYT